MPAGPGQAPVRAPDRVPGFRRPLGLIDEFCAHRGVSLWFGRNEECGLGCPYHGWKYDVSGQCIEVPSEPEESGFAQKIKLKNYPAEARFRVDYPNSKPRATRIIALDEEAERALAAVRAEQWHGARFLTYASAPGLGDGLETLKIDARLKDADGRDLGLVEEIESADAVIMVVGAGSSAEAAAIVGNACLARGVMTTGLIIAGGDRGPEVARTLQSPRPVAAMLVLSDGSEYITEMLTALRA